MFAVQPLTEPVFALGAQASRLHRAMGVAGKLDGHVDRWGNVPFPPPFDRPEQGSNRAEPAPG